MVTRFQLKGITVRKRKNRIAGFYVGNIRDAANTTIDCFTAEEIKLVSQDENKNPSFSYNPETGEKSCSHCGPIEERMKDYIIAVLEEMAGGDIYETHLITCSSRWASQFLKTFIQN